MKRMTTIVIALLSLLFLSGCVKVPLSPPAASGSDFSPVDDPAPDGTRYPEPSAPAVPQEDAAVSIGPAGEEPEFPGKRDGDGSAEPALFTRYGKSSRIPDYLGEPLYRDYCVLMDALFRGETSAALTHCRSEEGFAKLKACISLMFLPKDLLRDPGFLSVSPFAFDADTGTVRIFYCWEDNTVPPEELPCSSLADYLSKISEFETTVTGILLDCGAGSGDAEETAIALFDWVSSSLTYEIDRTDSAYTALFNHRGYCSIYASLYQFLCEEAGIPCLRVSGAASGGWNDHEWDLVQLDGNWYHVDCTYQGADHYAPGYYFGMTDSTSEALGHGSTDSFALSDELSNGLPRPVCTDDRFDLLYRVWMVSGADG